MAFLKECHMPKGSVFEALGMAAKKEDSIVDNGDKGSDGEWFA